MKTNKVKRVIVGLSLAVMLLVGIGVPTAEAQRRRGWHRPPRRIIVYRHNPFWYRHYDPFWSSYYYPSYRVVDPIAYQKERGFSEGKDEGEEDAKKGRMSNATGHKDYLKSDSIHFRESFVRGYNAGYREEMAEIRDKGRD